MYGVSIQNSFRFSLCNSFFDHSIYRINAFVSRVWFRFRGLYFDWLIWRTCKCHERGTCFAELRACVMTVNVARYSTVFGKEGLAHFAAVFLFLSTAPRYGQDSFDPFLTAVQSRRMQFSVFFGAASACLCSFRSVVNLGGEPTHNCLCRFSPPFSLVDCRHCLHCLPLCVNNCYRNLGQAAKMQQLINTDTDKQNRSCVREYAHTHVRTHAHTYTHTNTCNAPPSPLTHT